MIARATWLAAALFLAFNLNLRAIGSRDTHVTEHVALSLAAHGDATLDEFPALVEAGLVRGYMTRMADGHVRSNYPIAPALVAAPAYWVAVRGGWIDPAAPVPARVEAVGKIVASGLTAIACALLYLVCGGMGIAIAVALGTPLWSSASQALWTHAPAAAAMAFALWSSPEVVRPFARGEAKASHHMGRGTEGEAEAAHHRAMRAALAGAAYALAIACRPLLVVFFVGAFFDLLRRRDRRIVALSAGALVVLGSLAIYNVATYGAPDGGLPALESDAVHQQTHHVASAWSGNPLTGLAGILSSPSRGLLVYCPLVLIAAAGAWRGRRDASLLLSVTIPVAAFLLGWSRYAVWWGGHSYGPRYASDIAIPLGVLIAHGWAWRVDAGWKAARTILIVWSTGVQAIGAVCYPGGAWNSVPADVDRAHERLWDWKDPQIARTLRAGVYKGT